jgi:hypothetical protein
MMTPGEWAACTDPMRMLEFLRERASDRKLRLFACACLRRVWRRLADSRLREVVQLAEAHADGAASEEAMLTAWRSVASEHASLAIPEDIYHAVGGVVFVSRDEPPWYGDSWAVAHVREVARRVVLLSDEPEAEARRQCALLRCQFSTDPLRYFRYWPLRPPGVFPWNDGPVGRMAQVIYDERTFEHLPILADALEDAGCDVAEVVQHCRGEGPHLRGCWVLDRILDRN